MSVPKKLFVLVFLVLLCGCVTTPKDDICSGKSKFVSCYNHCRQMSKNYEDMSLCPMACYEFICNDLPMYLLDARGKGGDKR